MYSRFYFVQEEDGDVIFCSLHCHLQFDHAFHSASNKFFVKNNTSKLIPDTIAKSSAISDVILSEVKLEGASEVADPCSHEDEIGEELGGQSKGLMLPEHSIQEVPAPVKLTTRSLLDKLCLFNVPYFYSFLLKFKFIYIHSFIYNSF